MDTAAINLIQRLGQLGWPMSPVVLTSLVIIVVFCLTQVAGHAVLALQTRLAVHRELARRYALDEL